MSPMGHVYADTDRTTNPTQNTERCDDMKKMLKKMLCTGLLLAMFFTALSTQAFASVAEFDDIYSFFYQSGLPLSHCVTENNVTTECTGADQIIIQSERFQVQVPGSYIKAWCSNFDTNTTTISTTGTVALQYLDNSDMPRRGEIVYVRMSLINFDVSKNVRANGLISAS